MNNVPAERAYRPESRNCRIYNKLSDVHKISLYYSNIGDNRIVDVLEYNEGSMVGLVDLRNYVIASAGNKVTLKKEYLQSLFLIIRKGEVWLIRSLLKDMETALMQMEM